MPPPPDDFFVRVGIFFIASTYAMFLVVMAFGLKSRGCGQFWPMPARPNVGGHGCHGNARTHKCMSVCLFDDIVWIENASEAKRPEVIIGQTKGVAGLKNA